MLARPGYSNVYAKRRFPVICGRPAVQRYPDTGNRPCSRTVTEFQPGIREKRYRHAVDDEIAVRSPGNQGVSECAHRGASMINQERAASSV